MIKAQLITIGTEITCGEVVNSNAAWISQRLEEIGVRVLSHLTVRDQYDEVLSALRQCDQGQVIVVSGGLGPTSDDITRQCVSDYAGCELEFDAGVWAELAQMYAARGLPLREAHKHQCHFPAGSARLKNPAGTALGFFLTFSGRQYFVLPGPPRELEAMWGSEVAPRLSQAAHSYCWVRWTCVGVPESEVAELVEKVIADSGVEVGYRATIPYVKIKLFVDGTEPLHQQLVQRVEQSLQPFLLGQGLSDVAEDVLRLWPADELHVLDEVTHGEVVQRLFRAGASRPLVRALIHFKPASTPDNSLYLRRVDTSCMVELRLGGQLFQQTLSLPYRLNLESERGRRSATEYALWFCAKQLLALSRQA